MAAPGQILIAIFADRPRAEATVDTIRATCKRGDIVIHDAALIEKVASGKVRVHEVKQLTVERAAGRGAAIGAALGLIFPPSVLASAALGAAAGALYGKLRDTGIKDADLKRAGAELAPGQAGVIAIVEVTWAERLTQALVGYDELARLVLDADEAAVLVGDPISGDVTGTVWTAGAGVPLEKPPAASPGADPQPAATPSQGRR
jgi:uncharacterized membrane protein